MQQPAIGSWARAGELVGLVAAVGAEGVTLFDPAGRQQVTLPAEQLTPLPAGAVTVTLTTTLPLPHGLGDVEVRRWVASLADDRVRDRARAALGEAGLDAAAALQEVAVDVRPAAAAACFCGDPPPLAAGTAEPCPRCGRAAVGPASSGRA